MIVGIVGAEAAKFTASGKSQAILVITSILRRPDVTGFTSGGCHLGGADIWGEDIAKSLGLPCFIFLPVRRSWSDGYKPRNIRIAETGDEIHNITVDQLPPDFSGMTFPMCYHCGTSDHVKSGGCWTAKYAQLRLHKPAFWHIIKNS